MLLIQKEVPANPTRMQGAQTELDSKLSALANAGFQLELAREDLETAKNPGGTAATTTTNSQTAWPNGQAATPPAAPVPDNAARQPGSVMQPGARQPGSGERYTTSEGSRRFVYRNGQGSFHLLGRLGTAAYSRGGQPQLTALDFVKERAHFLFYRPRLPDSSIIEWAFAKYPEFPAGDGQPRYAVWCHDSAGWHWEWTHREAPLEASPTLPPVPGPVSATSSAAARSTGLVAGERPGRY